MLVSALRALATEPQGPPGDRRSFLRM